MRVLKQPSKLLCVDLAERPALLACVVSTEDKPYSRASTVRLRTPIVPEAWVPDFKSVHCIENWEISLFFSLHLNAMVVSRYDESLSNLIGKITFFTRQT